MDLGGGATALSPTAQASGGMIDPWAPSAAAAVQPQMTVDPWNTSNNSGSSAGWQSPQGAAAIGSNQFQLNC